ncbi:MAG: hypothetical protein ACSW73_03210 [Spirochaetales bacterium]
MKKTLFIILALVAALLVCVSCDNSLDADVFTPDPTPETDPNKMPLTLEFIEAGELTIIPHGEYGALDVYYAINGGEKTLYSTPVSAAAGDKVTLYRTLKNAKASYPYISIGCSKDCYVYGNVMSLIDPDNYATKTEVVVRALLRLFADNTHIKNHESIDLVLPATTLADSCYAYMFDGCTGLTKAPILPATTLSDACYRGMFNGCTGLTKAPELPATTLKPLCYDGMFEGCTGLTKAPELPATTLADLCYYDMFRGCTNLTTAPALPAETLANRCYGGMFQSCTSLEEAPALPATTLANLCYEYMFKECSSLNKVTCMATTNINIDNTEKWLEGVAATGDFYKASGASWTTGSDSGIPTGWTSHDAN